MEAMTNSADVKGNRHFSDNSGIFHAMKMVLPLEMEEIEYVEDRLRMLEERIL